MKKWRSINTLAILSGPRYIQVEADPNYVENTWTPKYEELMKKYGLKLVYNGTPFGCPEDVCFIYESDVAVEKYRDFRFDMAISLPGSTFSSSTTIIAL